MNKRIDLTLRYVFSVALLAYFWCGTSWAEELEELIFIRSLLANQSGLIDVAIDAEDRKFILEDFPLIWMCDQNDECEPILGGYGSSLGMFKRPKDLDLYDDGNIAVADTGNNRVQLCSLQGGCELLGDANGKAFQFSSPTGIAIDSQNKIAVTEPEDKRFQICEQKETCTAYEITDPQTSILVTPEWVAFGTENELIIIDDQSLIWICATPNSCNKMNLNNVFGGVERDFQAAIVSESGSWVFADRQNGLIYLCTASGSCQFSSIVRDLVGSWRSVGPEGVAFDSQGNIYVPVGDRLQIYQMERLDGPYIPFNLGLNDAWFQPSHDGQGFLVNVFDERGNSKVFVAWFTFETEVQNQAPDALLGSPDQRWLTAQGLFNTYTANLDVYLTEGALFLDNTYPVEQRIYGSLTLRFRDCETGVLSYNLPENGLTGEVELVRIRPDSVELCEGAVATWQSLVTQ